MYSYSKSSLAKLSECEPELQMIFNEAIKICDITILTGARGQEAQDRAFEKGFSKLKWPMSKHNTNPSKAVDAKVYQPGKSVKYEFYFLAGVIKSIAWQLREQGKIKSYIRWGGDWDGDNNFSENKFNDLYHFELR